MKTVLHSYVHINVTGFAIIIIIYVEDSSKYVTRFVKTQHNCAFFKFVFLHHNVLCSKSFVL